MLVLEIPMDPVAKGRPRISTVGGRPIAFTPQETRTAERFMAAFARIYMNENKRQVLIGALSVEATFWLRKPKSVKRLVPTTKPDLDNYIKMLDAFNGILWEDDSQIFAITASKKYCAEGTEPRICIEVQELLSASENDHKKTTIRGKGTK